MKRIAITGSLLATILCITPWANGQETNTNEDLKPVASEAGKTDESAAASVTHIKVQLKEGMVLEGSPTGVDSLTMASLFGEATIPLDTIAGIRFAQKTTEQSTVVLLNGDALTGDISLTELKFFAEWGQATVNVSHIVSVVFRPDLSWSSVSTPNGNRWQLKKESNIISNTRTRGALPSPTYRYPQSPQSR